MFNIDRFEIDMLDVKAADAFLIHAFTNGGQEYVVLVDAGNECDGDKILNHIKKYYNQQYIDLAICTHCDSDHYGGFKRLIEEHNKGGNFKINKFWIHNPYTHVDIDDVKYIRKKRTLKERLNEAYAFSDGSNLLQIINDSHISYEEPFTGKCYNPLNIEVLGPDMAYYESLIPDFRIDVDFKDEQDEDYQSSANKIFESEDEFYKSILDKANDDPSKVNQSSVIFVMRTDNGNYLFTGDAGINALLRVVKNDTNEELKNLTFLKVPHHGSKHNLSNALISYFHPNTAYISTESYGKYASRCTVNAFKKIASDVYSTHKHSSMCHHSINIRTDYSSATPL